MNLPQKHENIIDDDYVKPTVLRSERKKFNCKTNFSFFGEVCVVDKKHRNCRKDWRKVGTLSFQASVLNKCHERADRCADRMIY